MSRPSVTKRNQWKQWFQQKAATAFKSHKRANVKVFLAGDYVVVKFYGKSVCLPASAVAAASLPVETSSRTTDTKSGRSEHTAKQACFPVPQASSYTTPKRTAAENRRRHVKRKQRDLQLLIQQNFSPDSAVFVTLTFCKSTQDLLHVSRECQKLFARLRRHVQGVKYIAVPERDDRGNWHVHLILDRELPLAKSLVKPFLDCGSIRTKSGCWEKLWTLGIVHQKKLDQGGNLGASIAAYVMKNATDQELAGHHTVWKSDNLQPWTELFGQDAVDVIRSIVREGLTPSYGYYCVNCGFVESMHVFEFCLNPQAAKLYKEWRPPNRRAA